MTKLLLLGLLASSVGSAQQTARLVSPEVHDGVATFRFRDPNAQKVTLNLESVKQPYVMKKDEAGVWSVTTGQLDPNYYGYSFEADGVRLLDPSNGHINPNLLNPSSSLHVPGSAPMPWENTDIAHGTVQHHFYHSGIVGDNRDFYVYTPPGYDAAAKTTYPVLYLLHGYSDDASGWTAVGKSNYILDSLIATAKIRPMIVAMPLGYGAPEIVHPTPQSGSALQNRELRERNNNKFRDSLVEEVIPMVEKSYKVQTNRDSRAIAGLSMGGAESLLTGLNRLDLFGWVGSFSAGGLGDDFAAAFPQLNAQSAAQLHLLWIACGTDDRLITPNRELVKWLKSKNINPTSIETPGMHTWQVWRNNLIAFAPLLFR
jgi:enterochelin esterase-like enzyme